MRHLARGAVLLQGLSWASVALAQVIVVPVATTPPAQPGFALPGDPIPEWIDPALGSTAAFARGCGHTAEVQLSTRPGANFATVVLLNHTERATQVTDETRAVFGGDTERWLELRSGARNIPANSWELFTYAFPSKEDFAGQGEIQLVLALAQGGQECELTAQLMRRPGAADESRSVVEYTSLNFHVGAGAGLSHFGGTGTVPQHPFVFLMGMGYYPWVRHGLHLHILGEFSGKGSAQPFVGDVPDATFFTGVLSMGYAYQRPLLGVLNFGYRVGPGAAAVEASVRGSDSGALATDYALGLVQSVHLDLKWGGPNGLGLTAYHVFLPNAELSGVPADGHRLGLLLTLFAGD